MSKNTILIFIFLLFFSIFIKKFVADIYTVPTASMLPTLEIGKKILVQKCFFSIEKNDILAFRLPQNLEEKLIKRCVGLPLDTLLLDEKKEYFLKEKSIQIADNQFFVIPKKGLTIDIDLKNMRFYKPLIEQSEDGQIGIIGAQLYINGEVKSTYTFQQNYYFMLGDNPSESYDSRQWGVVAEKFIFGKMR